VRGEPSLVGFVPRGAGARETDESRRRGRLCAHGSNQNGEFKLRFKAAPVAPVVPRSVGSLSRRRGKYNCTRAGRWRITVEARSGLSESRGGAKRSVWLPAGGGDTGSQARKRSGAAAQERSRGSTVRGGAESRRFCAEGHWGARNRRVSATGRVSRSWTWLLNSRLASMM